jgi:hypothetical protein
MSAVQPHHQLTFSQGDIWKIVGRLYDVNRQPLDITGADIEWGLLNSSNVTAVETEDVTITFTDAVNGLFLIVVPAAITAALPPGGYVDNCRVSSASIAKETYWFGPIAVRRSPFEPEI